MYSKTLLLALCLNSLVNAAPVPNDQPWGNAEPAKWSWTKTIQDVAGSPFGNGIGNGNGNSAGNGNKGNGNNNFGGNGNDNGNSNSFGNGNGFLSGNSGLGIGRRNDWSKQPNGQPWGPTSLTKPAWSISNIAGSPFGNGNGNGNGNTAGSGNANNGNGNFGKNGNGNGNNNEFGNGNSFFSGNQGLGIGKKVRREASAASIPPGTFYLVPPQLADSLNQDFSQLFTVVIPQTGPAVIKGALTGKYPGTKRDEQVKRRQVLTGLENIIAQAASDEAPPDRSGFFGINIK